MIGRQVQNYRIEELIGEGGMGTVYRAVDVLLGRDVALKMLHQNLINQSSFFERFKNEAKILARLNHPNIAILHNFLLDKGDYFMVMEYIQGQDLDQLLKQKGALEPNEAVRIILSICDGLTHAHEKGVLHRDLKPSNFIVTNEGQVKIMDFGIAKAVGSEKLTQVNTLIGTLEYMAPELLKGDDPSIQSDLYALGVVFFELLSGKMPFEAKTDFEMMDKIIHQPPLKKYLTDKKIPHATQKAINTLLEKKAQKRPKTAIELKKLLRQSIAGTPVTPQKSSLAVFAVFIKSKLKTVQFPQITNVSKSVWIILVSVLVAVSLLLFLPKNSSKKAIEPQEEIKITELTQRPQSQVANVKEIPSIYKNSEDQELPEKNNPIVEKKKVPKKTQKTSPKRVKSSRTKPSENKITNTPEKKAREEQIKEVPKVQEKVKKELIKKESKPIKITLSGQKLTLSLTEKVNSKNLKTGQQILLKVSKPLILNGKTVFERNAPARGKISDLRKGTVLRKELLELRITEVQASNGKWVPVKAATFRQTAKSSTQPVIFNIGQQFIAETSYTTLTF